MSPFIYILLVWCGLDLIFFLVLIGACFFYDKYGSIREWRRRQRDRHEYLDARWEAE